MMFCLLGRYGRSFKIFLPDPPVKIDNSPSQSWDPARTALSAFKSPARKFVTRDRAL